MLDIVIVSYGTKELTINCINSIKDYTDVPYNIFVVDNNSPDNSVEALKLIEGITLIENKENLGYGRACNIGAKAGNAPYIIFLNSDVRATPGWAKPMINCFKKSKKIAVVGPKLLNPNGLINGVGVVGTNANPVIRGWMDTDNGQYNKQIDCVSVCGAAFMIARKNIPTLGLFDERYFFYYEETDYCYNARDKGYRLVYCPDSTMIHHHQGSCKDFTLLTSYFAESDAIFKAKWANVMGDERVYG